MRNLARINNYYNNIESLKDWHALAGAARESGRTVADLPKACGWRKRDKAYNELRRELAQSVQRFAIPACPNHEPPAPAFTVSAGELFDAEGCVACDYCGKLLEPEPIEGQGA